MKIIKMKNLKKKSLESISSKLFEVACKAYSNNFSWHENDFLESLKNKNNHYYFLVDRDEIVGFSSFTHVFDEVEILNLAISPKYQSRGFGKQLLAKLIEEVRHSARYIFLEVRATNLIAQKLYDSFGFQKMAKRKNYYLKPNEDAFNLVLNLEYMEEKNGG